MRLYDVRGLAGGGDVATSSKAGRYETQNLKTRHLIWPNGHRFWVATTSDKTTPKQLGQRIWLADINEGRSAEKTVLVRRIGSKWPNMSHQRPPYA
jgi:hypothetical protein